MMDFEIINTKRLVLKGFYPENIKYIFENFSKSEIKEILGHRSETDYLKEEIKYKKGYSSYNRSFILFLLIDKASNNIIGRCGLHNWNKEHRRAEIGYVMEEINFKGMGLMSEAVSSILDYGFNIMCLNRIEVLVATSNIPSIKLIDKFNFTREGILRQHLNVLDTYEDSIIFSKLFKEYNNE